MAANLRSAAATIVICCSLLAGPNAHAAQAAIYDGPPDLGLAVSLVEAGTGRHGFSSEVLFSRTFGKNRAAENDSLLKRYGFAAEAQYFAVMDFTIDDLLRIARERHIVLPPADPSASASPAALAARLHVIGRLPDGRYDVGYMIERLMTHHIHHVVMGDIDRRFSPQVNAAFHIVLTRVVEDGVRGGPQP